MQFLDLTQMFRDQIARGGAVTPGRYTLDLYFEKGWVGKVTFKVSK